MKLNTIILLQIATGLGLFLFWIAFFTIGLAPENPPAGFFEYEHSFPLPDGVLGIGLLLSGMAMYSGKAYGKQLSLACAGALIFLGLVDFSFNIQNGMYAISTIDLILNAFINIWSLGLGVAIIVFHSKN